MYMFPVVGLSISYRPSQDVAEAISRELEAQVDW
jgi:hypothetical protein